jgi:chemotaxis protein CheZ
MLERSARQNIAMAEHIRALRERYPQPESAQVAEMVYAVLSTMNGDLTTRDALLLAEVEELAQTLAHARAEIAALRADDINVSHIPSATDELDAIVAHTATATDNILECCERLDVVAVNLTEAPAQALRDVTTRIYEACSFQDITGQRITKVVATLKTIEAKVAHILNVFASHAVTSRLPPPPSPAPTSEAVSLLNGPQLPMQAMDQSDIDALLASFD